MSRDAWAFLFSYCIRYLLFKDKIQKPINNMIVKINHFNGKTRL